jgi:hypothetical protein
MRILVPKFSDAITRFNQAAGELQAKVRCASCKECWCTTAKVGPSLIPERKCIYGRPYDRFILKALESPKEAQEASRLPTPLEPEKTALRPSLGLPEASREKPITSTNCPPGHFSIWSKETNSWSYHKLSEYEAVTGYTAPASFGPQEPKHVEPPEGYYEPEETPEEADWEAAWAQHCCAWEPPPPTFKAETKTPTPTRGRPVRINEAPLEK